MDDNLARVLDKRRPKPPSNAGPTLQAQIVQIVAQDLSLGMRWNFMLYGYYSVGPGPGPGPAGRNKNSKMSGRTLSACDVCRQSKVRCTGGNPCLTCQWSQRSGNYSPGGRLGRPKGSKNKRTLMQQILNLNKEQPSLTQTDTNKSTADVMQWIGSGEQQRQQRQQRQQPQLEPDLISFRVRLGTCIRRHN
ncbi:Zn(II)2Cys6 transcription factor domain-containing protein [Aspergillus novofumigatus IBT 16806]|uniref:Zn(2)-C6 fungal-type domain-containing protein n=1 Tax=Aspergillus novofumigatus (strain IBT 16806) TaxID=1392255 RepID=A0A2I1C8K5_ASPN1|nr:uncharacterized protein P174DRAFT_420528 [Aspergillus novofumigatus IBT 16806]PKX93959.1 hypothetical protein P174DRAFT_420528 [Aspergillus novofumigatus IBT 16806]